MSSEIKVIVVDKPSSSMSFFSSIHEAVVWMLGRNMKDLSIYLPAPEGVSTEIGELEEQLTAISNFSAYIVKVHSLIEHPNNQCEPDCVVCCEESQNGK